jgi:hypothetical protein
MSIPPNGSNISLSELSKATFYFASRYSLNQTNGDPGFPGSFMVRWTDLKSIVDQVTSPSGNPYVAPENLAIRYIHRFDTTTQVWFLTMVMMEMAPPNATGQRQLTEIPNQRYDLINGLITPSGFIGDYDPVYFSNLYYFDGSQYVALDTTKHVMSITYPWLIEIEKLYTDNYQNTVPTETVFLVFSSCSFYADQSLPNKFANIDWPHTTALSINEGGRSRMANSPVSPGILFKTRAADMGTLNPPGTGAYILPPDLHW